MTPFHFVCFFNLSNKNEGGYIAKLDYLLVLKMEGHVAR